MNGPERDNSTVRLRSSDTIVSAEPLVVFDGAMRIVQVNSAAERLLGRSAAEAIGQACRTFLHARDEHGAALCDPSCQHARYAREGWPVPSMRMTISTAEGPKRVSVDTIVVRNADGPLICRILQEDRSSPAGSATAQVDLTPRQQEVLELLAHGVGPRSVARRLGIAEPTVRNHIRAILVELRAHSQLEAVARARELGLV
jgi:DNA-binding CsgD family transcriptional regulator